MSEKHKILVIDDEAQILRVLRHLFSSPEYSIKTAVDGESGLAAYQEWSPDLVITDLQMPAVDGLEVCKQIRTSSNVPIIVLSVRDEEKMIIKALDAGADDYITKPFGSGELLARVRSVLRRVPEKVEAVVEAGDFRIDIDAHIAEVRGKEVRLTPKEFDLLVTLVRNPDRVLTHTFLLQKVWGNYYAEQPEALRVLVGTLRKKIEQDPSRPVYLLTEPWIGYRFIAQPSPL
ncbi:MAG: response regulator transcription factor [Acidobacteria bacterium]|nr:response regulator transcription factor [Acidobacteriota bacterium]